MTYCRTASSVPYGSGSGFGSCYGGGGSVGLCGLAPAYGVGCLSGAGGRLGIIDAGFSYGPAACSSQLPGSEVVIQPPPCTVSIPAPCLSLSAEPVSVSQVPSGSYPALDSSGGSSSGSPYEGYGRVGYGGGYGGGYCNYGGYSGCKDTSEDTCLPTVDPVKC
ncbi:shematrin-like protein 2 [Rhineura floridana]|uniref:shematrin-like protein 2 n=1 Tax=Rhineura floridana TaxID=261503 RepID=UPI002AC885E7|nr:shematrin-like protein 2 [Rhineura floridana]